MDTEPDDCTCLSYYQQDPACPWHHPTDDGQAAWQQWSDDLRERARVEEAFTVVGSAVYDGETDTLEADDDPDTWVTAEKLEAARAAFSDL